MQASKTPWNVSLSQVTVENNIRKMLMPAARRNPARIKARWKKPFPMSSAVQALGVRSRRMMPLLPGTARTMLIYCFLLQAPLAGKR